MKRGFDPAFSMDMPKPEDGLGHAFMRPAESLTDLSLPIVPVLMNCYFAPQPTGTRCYEFGKAMREAIEAFPGDLRVAVARLRRPVAHARRQQAPTWTKTSTASR